MSRNHTLARVIITPRNEENPYLPLLRNSLLGVGVPTTWFAMTTTPSQTINTIIAPAELVWMRLRGRRILHIHWVYRFAWKWSRSIPILRTLPRLWFGFVIWFTKLIGFRLVFTCHDLVPLNSVFDDDIAARWPLLKHADAIITITEYAKSELIRVWGVHPDRLHVIPEGAPLAINNVDRTQARKQLGVADEPLLVSFGHIDEYKGIDLFLDAVSSVPRSLDFSIRILGESRDPELMNLIAGQLVQIRNQHRDVDWSDRRFSDDQLHQLLVAGDFAVMPFKTITNSTTMRMAMANEVILLLPNFPELSDVPRNAAYFFDPLVPGSLCESLSAMLEDSADNWETIRRNARRWSTSWSWEDVADATKRIYENL